MPRVVHGWRGVCVWRGVSVQRGCARVGMWRGVCMPRGVSMWRGCARAEGCGNLLGKVQIVTLGPLIEDYLQTKFSVLTILLCEHYF